MVKKSGDKRETAAAARARRVSPDEVSKPARATRAAQQRPNSAPARQFTGRIVIPASHLVDAVPLPEPIAPRQLRLKTSEERYLQSLELDEQRRLLRDVEELNASRSEPLRFRLMRSELPNKHEAWTKLQSCENQKYEAWVEAALSLPLGKFAPPPLRAPSDGEVAAYLRSSKRAMDRAICGQAAAKDEVLRLIAQWLTGGQTHSFALALEGQPGIGKTTFAQTALAAAMARPFCKISLGGMSDGCHLLGHSFTFEGAICGRIAECLRTCGVLNPILYFDELDKVSKTPKGDEIINMLIHLTDKEQNAQFRDRYFHGIDLDLSDALCVFSYNSANDISPILLERLNVVHFEPPSTAEKVTIARQHLLPKLLSRVGLAEDALRFDDALLEHVVRTYTDEPGVRALDKCLSKIVTTLNVVCRSDEPLFGAVDLGDEAERFRFPYACSVETVSRILQTPTTTTRAHFAMYS